MRSVVPMRVAKLGYIALSSLMCAFGLTLMIWPGISLKVFALCAGITLIAFGVIKVVGYLSRDLYRLAFQYDLALACSALPWGCWSCSGPAM